MKELSIEKNSSNQRIDKYLLKYLNKATKAFIYKMIRKKNIKLNGKKITGNEILNEGDTIELFLSEETIDGFQEERVLKQPKYSNIEIIYEDNNVLIVNKFVGVLSHPEKAEDTDTLIDRILYYLHENNEYDLSKTSTFTPALCNRLDRNTSGIIICGKNLATVQELNRLFKEKEIDKYYITLVKGRIIDEGILKGYHTKNEKTNQVDITNKPTKFSKEVITEYKPINYKNEYTLLKIKLVTGKSHQIRAHLKSINHPVIGDRKYGDPDTNAYFRKTHHIDKQLLHAHELIFNKAEGDLSYLSDQKFVAPIPNSFKKLIDCLFAN